MSNGRDTYVHPLVFNVQSQLVLLVGKCCGLNRVLTPINGYHMLTRSEGELKVVTATFVAWMAVGW